jgi:hypothetical protein
MGQDDGEEAEVANERSRGPPWTSPRGSKRGNRRGSEGATGRTDRRGGVGRGSGAGRPRRRACPARRPGSRRGSRCRPRRGLPGRGLAAAGRRAKGSSMRRRAPCGARSRCFPAPAPHRGWSRSARAQTQRDPAAGAHGRHADAARQAAEPAEQGALERRRARRRILRMARQALRHERRLLGVIRDEPGRPEQPVPLHRAKPPRDPRRAHPLGREPQGVAHRRTQQGAREALVHVRA